MRPTLRSARQFELVYTQGRKRTASAVVLFHLEQAPDSRLAFVASRKVGGAVQRNRAKRLMRAAVSEILSTTPAAAPGWVVLVARRDILKCTSREVGALLRQLLRLPGVASPRPDGNAAAVEGRA